MLKIFIESFKKRFFKQKLKKNSNVRKAKKEEIES